MPRKFPNDLWYFDSFDSALDKANALVKDYPNSEFEIVYSSLTQRFELWLDRYSIKEDFPALFGPGSVPGWLKEEDIDAINYVSGLVPPGDFLELGSFVGKSTVEWAKRLPGKVYSIDSFNTPINFLRELIVDAEFDLPIGDNQFEIFQHYTKEYKNIHPIQILFDKNFTWDKPLSGVFEDSDHRFETLNHSLTFWYSKLISKGVLCGHDYGDWFDNDVKHTVDRFAAENNLTVNTCKNSSIWYIIKQ